MAIQDTIPKSRMTLRYKTDINGQPENLELPLRILIMGDFSGPNSKKVPLADRKIISFKGNNINPVIEEMGIHVNVTDDDEKRHLIPIKNVDSFHPFNVCKSITSLDDMVRSKRALNTLLSSINNSAKFREALKGLINNPDAVNALKNALETSYASDSKLSNNLLDHQLKIEGEE
ncbi:type VI secretion system contractile sheath small subunit [Microbulbifer variabilis]|uniref:type VI secretion system contractile sheath small subunit n=1 Tax=Microbulbifer variabilis TaxID=266805 RepID=UPI001CFD7494|nr:type VI secretion system contractile sheath small subunit [Microbulbifer variabilis]